MQADRVSSPVAQDGSCIPGPGPPAPARRSADRIGAGTGGESASMHGTSPVRRGVRSVGFVFCSLSPRVVPGSGVPRCVPIRAHPSAAGDRRAPVPVVR